MELSEQEVCNVLSQTANTHTGLFIADNLETVLLKNHPDATIWFITSYEPMLGENGIAAAYFYQDKATKLFSILTHNCHELRQASVKDIHQHKLSYENGEAIRPLDVFGTLYNEIVDPDYDAI